MSSARNVLDIKKAAASRAKARDEMLPGPPKPRPQRLRDKRRRRRILVGCICALAMLGLFGGVAGLSHLERFAVRDVSVSGAVAVQPESLVASVHAGLDADGFRLFARDNVLLYPKRAIEEALAREFPRIQDVALSRPSLLAQAVIVTVEERQPYARWCPSETDDTCFLMDDTGFVFAEADGATPLLAYGFRGGLARDRAPIGQWFLRGRLSESVALLDRLAAAGFPSSGLGVDTENDFTVSLADGPDLYIRFDADHESVVRNLRAALEAESLAERMGELQYIDLRFGNRVYFR